MVRGQRAGGVILKAIDAGMAMALETCHIAGCGRDGTMVCARCGQPVCDRHVVADFQYLPGGQRPYCSACDDERRRLYQAARRQGLKAILWSGGGAVAGSLLGGEVGTLLFTDSFAHTVATDIGFVLGLAVALVLAVRPVPSR
ncbi:MAG TPA: hypothetical protein VFZ25_12290 [Chloroflexota bacterium]|nr:hypothetical protein [Chloroflexota bacterium]